MHLADSSSPHHMLSTNHTMLGHGAHTQSRRYNSTHMPQQQHTHATTARTCCNNSRHLPQQQHAPAVTTAHTCRNNSMHMPHQQHTHAATTAHTHTHTHTRTRARLNTHTHAATTAHSQAETQHTLAATTPHTRRATARTCQNNSTHPPQPQPRRATAHTYIHACDSSNTTTGWHPVWATHRGLQATAPWQHNPTWAGAVA